MLVGLNGVNRQLLNGLKFLNRQPSKSISFLPSTVKNAEWLTVIKFLGINQISLFQLIFTDI